jgi:hypothetical protein
MAQALGNWSITLKWGDVLNVVLAAVAILQFFRNRRTKQVCNEILKRESVKTAAHGFTEMSRMASDLETSVRKGEWESSHDLAKRLLILLAEASGAWSDTLEQTDVDNFDAARTEITVVEKSVSVAIRTAPTPEEIEEMKQRCVNSSAFMATIAGRLKAPPELQERRDSKWQAFLNRFKPTGLSSAEARDLRKTAKEIRKP